MSVVALAGIAIAAFSIDPGASQEIQFDEHKLLIVYGEKLRAFEEVLDDCRIDCRPEMKFVTEAEHVHSSREEYADEFEQLKMRLGMDTNYE